MNIERVPLRQNPKLFDKLIGEIQQGLADNLEWLNHAFGRCERLVKNIDGRRYYSPNIYVGGNEYELISPDSNFGNYCFFVLNEPENLEYEVGDDTRLRTPFDIIFWVDMRTIPSGADRNTEAVKQDILHTLNGRIHTRYGRYFVTRIYDRAENVFNGFTLDEVDNQFLMQPFCGWRFYGELDVFTECDYEPEPEPTPEPDEPENPDDNGNG